MIYRRKLLQPVKREDFSTTISSEVTIGLTIEPENYFSSLIDHINKFAVGQYFWFIANLVNGDVERIGGMLQQIAGIPTKLLLNSSPDVLFQRTHPEDISQMFAFTNQWIQIFSKVNLERRRQLHPTIYIRLKNQEQLYKWVMVQYADHLFDNDENLIYAFTLVTDISHIKTESPAMMSILDSIDETCQHFYCSDEKGLLESKGYIPNLTKREIEILNQLLIGQSSKQIAGELNISIKTVDNHRQSMLRKTNCKSSAELIIYAIKSGYL